MEAAIREPEPSTVPVTAAGPAARARPRTRPRSLTDGAPRGMGWGIALSLLPGALLFATFFLVPLGIVVATSFSHWDVVGTSYNGLANYRELLGDSVFWHSVTNTAIYAAAGVFLQIPLAIFVALILSRRPRGWQVFRTILFVPVVISGAAYALIFANFYNASYGPLNRIVGLVGLGTRDWLFDVHTALPALIGTYVFNIGFFMILVMAEITALPVAIAEASLVDGASSRQRDLYVTIPLLRHVIGTCVLLSLLSSLSFFDIVYILTSGGPADATVSLTVYAFREYASGRWGYANAIGSVIVVMGFVLIVATRRAFRLGERTA
jgi:raffinose/stachyose/melibiose transport system permease protein